MQTSPGGVRTIRGAMLAAAALLASGFAFSLVRGFPLRRAAVASEEDALMSRSAEDTGVRLTLDWADCSEEDEESDYEARLIGLAVRYTNSGKLVESIQGEQQHSLHKDTIPGACRNIHGQSGPLHTSLTAFDLSSLPP